MRCWSLSQAFYMHISFGARSHKGDMRGRLVVVGRDNGTNPGGRRDRRGVPNLLLPLPVPKTLRRETTLMTLRRANKAKTQEQHSGFAVSKHLIRARRTISIRI